MPGKVTVSRKKKPVRKRRLNPGLLVLGASLVFILGVILVTLLASGLLTEKPSGVSPTAQAVPDLILATKDGDFRLSQQRGEVVLLYFSFPG